MKIAIKYSFCYLCDDIDTCMQSNQTNSIGFTSNSSYLASGGSDGIVKIWDLKKRGVGMSFKAHFSSIQSVHWSIDDTTIASASLLGIYAPFSVEYYQFCRRYYTTQYKQRHTNCKLLA